MKTPTALYPFEKILITLVVILPFWLLPGYAAASDHCQGSGGQIIAMGPFCLHRFTVLGYHSFTPPAGVNEIDLLLIGGGGGGGGFAGGGGGAGGFIAVDGLPISSGSDYLVHVGSGGRGGDGLGGRGGNGEDSRFGAMIALGGGGGGGFGPMQMDARPGGSGGGGGWQFLPATAAGAGGAALQPGAVGAGFGGSGGAGGGTDGQDRSRSGGGGGAGGEGVSQPGLTDAYAVAPHGGSGRMAAISGDATDYAGGGGGGGTSGPAGMAGTGGVGGGGNGGMAGPGVPGGTNSGGGGGGGGENGSSGYAGGSGGSGVVLVRYRPGNAILVNGTTTLTVSGAALAAGQPPAVQASGETTLSWISIAEAGQTNAIRVRLDTSSGADLPPGLALLVSLEGLPPAVLTAERPGADLLSGLGNHATTDRHIHYELALMDATALIAGSTTIILEFAIAPSH